MRTVGLVAATLTVGVIVAVWWRDIDPPKLLNSQPSETQTAAARTAESAESSIPPPPAGNLRPQTTQQPETLAPTEAVPVAGVPVSQSPSVAPGESNLAALEVSASTPVVETPPAVADPSDAAEGFRERPTMAAYLSSQRSEERVHFALDQYELEPDAVATLEALVAKMEGADQILKLVVDGHCDDTGTDQYNQALSEMRAEVVVEFLQQRGFTVREVVTRGFGERVPVAPGRDETSRAKNRRADIRIDWVRKTPVSETSLGKL